MQEVMKDLQWKYFLVPTFPVASLILQKQHFFEILKSFAYFN